MYSTKTTGIGYFDARGDPTTRLRKFALEAVEVSDVADV